MALGKAIKEGLIGCTAAHVSTLVLTYRISSGRLVLKSGAPISRRGGDSTHSGVTASIRARLAARYVARLAYVLESMDITPSMQLAFGCHIK